MTATTPTPTRPFYQPMFDLFETCRPLFELPASKPPAPQQLHRLAS